MAEGKVEFELVSPEKLVFSKPVDMVVVPGEEGDFGVLPRHSALISTVRPGVIGIYEGKQLAERIFVAGGFAEVTPERCTVLAEHAVPCDEIDRAACEQELRNAEEDMADAKTDLERAEAKQRADIARAKVKAVA